MGCFGTDETGGDEAEAPEPQTIDGLPPEFAKLAEVWEILEREHIDAETLDPSALADGAHSRHARGHRGRSMPHTSTRSNTRSSARRYGGLLRA